MAGVVEVGGDGDGGGGGGGERRGELAALLNA